MWIKKYQIPFQSRLGTQYMVYVYEQGTQQGTVTTLKGAAEPFVTQEDDSDDIFTPVRGQTGYLRVIDTDGTVMESLMPHNNIEKMVRLYSGTWNDDFTTFTDGDIQWQGFLCAQAYSQPADNGQAELEFPVKSMLAALEDVPMDYSDAARVSRIGFLLAKASYGLLNSIQSPWSEYYFIDDIGDSTTVPSFVDTFMNWGVLFEDVNTRNDGTVIETPSFYDAISEAAAMFGVQLREKGDKLFVAQYDMSNRCLVKKMTWVQIRMTGGTVLPSPAFTYIGAIGANSTLLSQINFIVKGSQRGYLSGRNKFTVLLSLNDNKFQLMPGVSERSDDDPYRIPCIGSTILAQPHTSATGLATESYNYYDHSVTYGWFSHSIRLLWTKGTASTFQNYVAQSVMLPSGRSRFMQDSRNSFTTGASPVRWSDGDILSSALWLNLIPCLGYDLVGGSTVSSGINRKVIYTITSEQEMQSGTGYINLSFRLNRFKLEDGNYIQWNKDVHAFLYIYFSLKIGNKYLDFDGTAGPQWVENADAICRVRVSSGGIVSNINNDYSGQGLQGGGIFARADGISGAATIKIFNFCMDGRDTINENQIFSFIMTDLLLSWVPAVNVTGTEDRENRYFRQENNGFNGNNQIDLIIGTYNANQPSASFIQRYANNALSNIENLPYRTGVGNTTEDERPEEHLLNRMIEQNGKIRKTLRYQTRDNVGDVMQTVFSNVGKKFFAIDAQHNWRNDEQDVKFIEVT